MINLKGKGAMTDRSLIVTIPDNGVVMDKKDPHRVLGHFVDVQLDQTMKHAESVRTGKSEAQTDPHLVGQYTKFKGKDGKQHGFTNHRIFYSESQIDKMREAASNVPKNHKPKIQKYPHSYVLGIKASLTPTGKGVIVNTSKPMAPTANPTFGKNIIERQDAVTQAAKAHANDVYKASKAEQKDPVKSAATAAPAKDTGKNADGPEA